MPTGSCVGSTDIIGTSKIGIGTCGLFGTFNRLDALTPPTPRSQFSTPSTNAPAKNVG